MYRYAQTNLQLYNQLRFEGYSDDDLKLIAAAYQLTFHLFTGQFRSSGKTFIASAVGAQPEIVEDIVTDFLIPPNDVTSLANTLIRLLSNPALAEEMGQAGRQRALNHFSENRRTENFLEINQNFSTYLELERKLR